MPLLFSWGDAASNFLSEECEEKTDGKQDKDD
jgi:hypothetical protein